MRLKEFRKARKLTQREFADILGMPLNTYQRYEKGVRDIKVDVLCKIADFYGVSTDELLGRQTKAFDTQPTLSKQEVQLVNMFRQMSDDDKEGFLVSARVYAFAGEAKKKGDEGARGSLEQHVAVTTAKAANEQRI